MRIAIVDTRLALYPNKVATTVYNGENFNWWASDGKLHEVLIIGVWDYHRLNFVVSVD